MHRMWFQNHHRESVRAYPGDWIVIGRDHLCVVDSGLDGLYAEVVDPNAPVKEEGQA